jgi:hypothetical protein
MEKIQKIDGRRESRVIQSHDPVASQSLVYVITIFSLLPLSRLFGLFVTFMAI